jgi:hypothetical protein
VFIHEVANYLSFLENVSKEGILNFGATENTVNEYFNFLNFSYLHKYYKIYSNEELKELIGRINNIQLLPEEKFRILNFKPKSEIELSLVNRKYIFLNVL